jgi:hypothetical protein
MIHKVPSIVPDHVHVIFELPACIWADQIALVGDFNQWDQTATPLRQDHDGVWRAEVELPVGCRYEFRYLVDGCWLTDYQADGLTKSAYGADNSIVLVSLPVEALRVERSCSQVWNHDGRRTSLS